MLSPTSVPSHVSKNVTRLKQNARTQHALCTTLQAHGAGCHNSVIRQSGLLESAHASSPVFFTDAGYAVVPFLTPRIARGWRADGRVIASYCAHRFQCAASFAPSQRLSGAGSRFLRPLRFSLRSLSAAPFGQPYFRASGKPHGAPSASSSRGGRSAPRAEPRRRRGQEDAFVSCPRAPHPIPPTSRFMRASSVGRTAWNKFLFCGRIIAGLTRL